MIPDAAAIWSYLGVFVALVAAGIGFPIPEEIPVVTGGMVSGHAAGDPDNHVRWFFMWPICILGVVISDVLLYGAGRWWGPRLLQYRWIKTRLLPPQRLEEIEGNFHKGGVKILLFARLLPGIRAPIFITAGIMRLPFTKFLLADSIYAVPGVSLLFFLGYWFTDQFMEIVRRAESVRPLIIVVVLTAVVTYLVIHFLRRPVSTGAPEDLPPIVHQVTQQVSPIVHQVTQQITHMTHIVGKGEQAPPDDAPAPVEASTNHDPAKPREQDAHDQPMMKSE